MTIQRHTVSGLAAGLAAVALLGTSASDSPDGRQDPGGGWVVQPDGGGGRAADAGWRCVGSFVPPRRVHGADGDYVAFGGRQRCTHPLDQDVEVYLERRIGGRWVAVARASRSASGALATVTGHSPLCNATQPTAYRLRAYGAAGRFRARPWAVTGPARVLGCRIIPF